ncbi:MAG: exopolysaccharide biosynthesis polyprenyl glycosylphosphotransferase [Phenylobacterium sp.]|uniref:exopolysaccharide biosynthesis polyprenyl glycosylphosphotransferase n=1 Tax=Phenylobacterium sp. TaxID=1871053 RepID=UPI00391AEA6C
MTPVAKLNAPVSEAPTTRTAQPPGVAPGAASGSAADRRGPFRPERLTPARERLHGRLVARLFQLGDAAALVLAGFSLLASQAASPVQGLAFLATGLGVLACLGIFKTYDFGRRESLAQHLSRVLVAVIVGHACGYLALAPSTPIQELADAVLLWAPAALAMITSLHLIWFALVRRWRANGRLVPNIVIVGATGAAERLIEAVLASREVNVLGVFDDRLGRVPGSVRGVPVLGNTRALLDHRIMPYVDRIVITVPAAARPRVRELIERLRILPNEISLLLDGEPSGDEAAAISRVADVPLAYISGPPMDHARALVKRMQDLVVGVIALVLTTPVMLGIALAVRLDSPGPILFRQRRHGFNNEEIVVWKFRSMRVADQDLKATRQVSAEDDRVTRVGRFIRRTSLDELPQLLNVLKGEMSLVGPRPHAIGMMTGDVESARLVAEYAHRHRMKPGMTGWAAIHGSRGPVDTPEAVRRRVALDVEYIERQSFWLDLYIMAMTLPCLLGDSKAVR